MRIDDEAHGRPCVKCGGTGDAFDYVHDDWVHPRRDCMHCRGTGDEGVRLIVVRELFEQ